MGLIQLFSTTCNKNGCIGPLYPCFCGLGASVYPCLMSEKAKFIPLSNRFLTQLSESRREKNGIAVPFRSTSNMAANTRGEHHNPNILGMQLAAVTQHLDTPGT